MEINNLYLRFKISIKSIPMGINKTTFQNTSAIILVAPFAIALEDPNSRMAYCGYGVGILVKRVIFATKNKMKASIGNATKVLLSMRHLRKHK